MFHQGYEVTVTRSEDHGVHFVGDLDGVNGHADVPVSLLRAAVEYLQILRLDLDTYFFQGFEKCGFFTAFGVDDVG